jgi:hypothetical protein
VTRPAHHVDAYAHAVRRSGIDATQAMYRRHATD